MTRLRTLVIGGAFGTIAMAAVAAPVGAADTKGTLAIVNGIPGTKVDVCLNGSEIKSNVDYGGHAFRSDKGTGPMDLKFYQHDRRRCRGH